MDVAGTNGALLLVSAEDMALRIRALSMPVQNFQVQRLLRALIRLLDVNSHAARVAHPELTVFLRAVPRQIPSKLLNWLSSGIL